jgi:nitrite reductase/ring-hydroxylating ferredoxin subunit
LLLRFRVPLFSFVGWINLRQPGRSRSPDLGTLLADQSLASALAAPDVHPGRGIDAMDTLFAVCPTYAVDEGQATGFLLVRKEPDGSNKRWPILITRKGNSFFGFENACPHEGTPLDRIPGEFMDEDDNFPARCYELSDKGQVEITVDGCIECGTCRVIGEGTGDIEWSYPRGGYGVLFKFG